MYIEQFRCGPTTFQFVGEDSEGWLVYKAGTMRGYPLTVERLKEIADWLVKNDWEAQGIVGGDVLDARVAAGKDGQLLLVVLAD